MINHFFSNDYILKL